MDADPRDGPRAPQDAPAGDARLADARPPDACIPLDAGFGWLFRDEFECPGRLVDDGTGQWSVADGVYQQTSCAAGPDSVVPGAEWGDQIVAAMVRGDRICGAGRGGIVAEAQGIQGCAGNRYYYCVIDFPKKAFCAGPAKGTCLGAGGAVCATAAELVLGEWYKLKLTVRQWQGETSIYCDLSGGNLPYPRQTSRTDVEDQLLTGSVGFVTDGLAASFDSLVAAPK